MASSAHICSYTIDCMAQVAFKHPKLPLPQKPALLVPALSNVANPLPQTPHGSASRLSLQTLQRSIGNRALQQALRAEAAPIGKAGGVVDPMLQREIEAARGKGQRLPTEVAQREQPAHGHGVSDVRLHTDARAAGISQSLNAEAFTIGRDVFFNEGAYHPGSAGGDHLLAHELAHVAQQRDAPAAPPGALQVGASNDPAEHQAQRAANGQSEATLIHSAAHIQRKMSFRYADVPDKITRGAKTAKALGSEGTFSQMLRALKDYDAINGIKKELVQLQIILKLSQQWAADTPDNKRDEVKARVLNAMAAPLADEIRVKEQEYAIHQVQFKHDYMADVKQESRARKAGATPEARKDNRFNAMSEPTKLYKRARALEKGQVAKDQDGREVAGQNMEAIGVMQQYGLNATDVLAIQTYVSENYNYMNPALGRDKDYLRARWGDVPMDSRESLAPLLKQKLGVENLKGVSHDDKAAAASDALIEQGRAHAKVTKWAMRKLPDCPPQTVYRGESLTEAEFAHLRKTKHKMVPNFWSLSTDRSRSETFARGNAARKDRPVGILYVIHYEHSGKDISGLSQNASEAEVLLLPKVPFTVISTTNITDGQIQMHEVHLRHSNSSAGATEGKKKTKK